MMLRMILVMLVMMHVMMLMVLVMMLLILVMMLLMLVMMVRRADSASLPEAPIYRICPALASGSELSCTSYFVRFFKYFPHNLIHDDQDFQQFLARNEPYFVKWNTHFCLNALHFLVYNKPRDHRDEEKRVLLQKENSPLHLFHQ